MTEETSRLGVGAWRPLPPLASTGPGLAQPPCLSSSLPALGPARVWGWGGGPGMLPHPRQSAVPALWLMMGHDHHSPVSGSPL